MSSIKVHQAQYLLAIPVWLYGFSGGSYGIECCNLLILKGIAGRKEIISETPVKGHGKNGAGDYVGAETLAIAMRLCSIATPVRTVQTENSTAKVSPE